MDTIPDYGLIVAAIERLMGNSGFADHEETRLKAVKAQFIEIGRKRVEGKKTKSRRTRGLSTPG